MKSYHLDNYLTEQTLGEALRFMFGENNVRKEVSVKVFSSRLRVDYVTTFNDRTIFVEFNGYRHYSNTDTIFRDRSLDRYCQDNNIQLVSIPYWVQLDMGSIPILFSEDVEMFMRKNGMEVTTTFPHGFVDKKAMRPVDFCIMGYHRFLQEFSSIAGQEPMCVAREIYGTLYEHEIFLPKEFAEKIMSEIVWMEDYPT